MTAFMPMVQLRFVKQIHNEQRPPAQPQPPRLQMGSSLTHLLLALPMCFPHENRTPLPLGQQPMDRMYLPHENRTPLPLGRQQIPIWIPPPALAMPILIQKPSSKI